MIDSDQIHRNARLVLGAAKRGIRKPTRIWTISAKSRMLLSSRLGGWHLDDYHDIDSGADGLVNRETARIILRGLLAKSACVTAYRKNGGN